MGKLETMLLKQLKIKDKKQDAENCLKIFNALKSETNSVMSSDWQVLTKCQLGTYPNKYYKPSKVGNIFLKGLNSID